MQCKLSFAITKYNWLISLLVLAATSFDAVVLQNLYLFYTTDCLPKGNNPNCQNPSRSLEEDEGVTLGDAFPASICLHEILTALHQLISRLFSQLLAQLLCVVCSLTFWLVHLFNLFLAYIYIWWNPLCKGMARQALMCFWHYSCGNVV